MRKVHFSPLLALALALSLSACATPSQTPSLAGSTAAPMAPSIFSSAPMSEPSTKSTLRIAGLKGPTTMGLVKLVADAADNKTANQYAFTMYGAADEIVAQLGKGNLDAAAIPANLASVLWNRTNGEIQMAAINTLGILYILESGDTIHSISDLKGKTIYSTGKGTTPEYVLNYVLQQNGLDPQKDVTIEYKAEASEIAALLSEGQQGIAMLPQPYVTTVMSKMPNLRVALDMTAEWDRVAKGESNLVTGVLVVRRAFAEQNQDALNAFLKEYKDSVAFVNSNVDVAAELVAKQGIVPSAAIAKQAIPACNITLIDGDEMQTKAGGYLQVLFEQNPASVGGKLPDEAFYYKH